MRALATLASCFLLSSLAAGQDLFGIPLVHDRAIRAIGDLNGDGFVDGITAAGGANLAAFLNDGNARFTAGPFFDLGSAGLPGLVLPNVGDWDGDGSDDVIVHVTSAHPLGTGILIAVSDGLGAFAKTDHVSLPSSSEYIATGNVDGDQSTDIACIGLSGATSEIHLIRNSGTGAIVSPPISVPYTVRGVEFGDLTGDGIDELVIGEATTGIVEIFSFSGGALVPTASYIASSGPLEFTAVPVIADMDTDGDLDVLIVKTGSPDGSVYLLENDGTGNLTVLPPSVLVDLVGALGLDRYYAGDWDNDGDMDLMGQGGAAFFSDLQARWVENLGGGNFAYSFAIQLPSGGIPGGVADFNGDGNVDFMTNQQLIFGDGKLESPLAYDFPTTERFNFALDSDDDGDLDLIDFFQSTVSDAFRYENDGAGGLIRSPVLLADPVAPDLNFGFPAAFEDLDGDGRREILLAVSKLVGFQYVHLVTRRFVDDGTGFFVDDGNAAPLGVELPLGSALMVDMDNDGDRDTMGGGELWLNNGSGVFTAGPTIVEGTILDAEDVDVDGDYDLLTVQALGTTAEVRLERHDGNLGFTREVLFTKSPNETFRFARFEDLDDDGDEDLLVLTSIGVSNVSLRVIVASSANGVFGAAVLDQQFPAPNGGVLASVGDANGDGASDLLLGVLSSGTPGGHFVMVLERSVSGLSYGAPARFMASGVQAFGDLDNDGDVDILGRSLHLNRRFEGPSAGLVQQFGAGVAGTSGAVPVLGSTGPVREGSQVELRVRRALGGSVALIARGQGPTSLVDSPFVGLTTYVFPILNIDVGALSGTPGEFATGEWTQSFLLPSGLSGQSFHFQAFILDAAGPSGLSATNGVTVQIGG